MLPASVAIIDSDLSHEPPALMDDERPLVANAVPARQREFAWGRGCARQALHRVGAPASSLLAGPRREPLWPRGYVGSISHCHGYVAAAAASCDDIIAVGIDAESLDSRLTRPVVSMFAAGAELDQLADQPLTTALLVFSAKESFYKAWYPITGQWLEFRDVTVTLTPGTTRFTISLRDDQPSPFQQPVTGHLHWGSGRILTAVVIPAPSAEQP